MKLDTTSFRYITKEEFRVLVSVEMGMRNHEIVPVPLIESIAKVSRGCTYKILQALCQRKLIAHDGKSYDGFRLTYHGYDFLALRALVKRGVVVGVGRRVGVGKESDVHTCTGPDGEVLAMKLHRLGRISFRAIKQKRDYLKNRQHASWMYMARLAAAKEFAYMRSLHGEGFPVPTPIDLNRHVVVMSFVDAPNLYAIRELSHPYQVLERLMRLIVRLARAGIVHGDFNEFNLLVDDASSKVTVIDFPQIVHLSHPNAEEMFDRDVQCVRDFFRKRFNIVVEKYPQYSEVLAEMGSVPEELDIQGMDRKESKLLVAAHEDATAASDAARGDAFEQSLLEGDAADEAEEDEDDGADDGEGAVADDAAAGDGGNALERWLLTAGAPEEEGGEETDRGTVPDSAAAEAGADAPAGTGERPEGDDSGHSSGDESAASEAPGQVKISTGGRRQTRRQLTAKEARSKLQRQQKQRPAKANNQKVKELRRAKHEIKEHL
mmetsp:Transcript_111424/g.315459  ORF Transcript_111424/g.315459 Transcript_111424/m.315459 type:complete len:492 (+) Transcript_111424:99-1574(+)